MRIAMLVVSALVTGGLSVALADNGTIGYAPAIETAITLDGDLSDWPDNRTQLPISYNYDRKPDDDNDFEAMVSFAYKIEDRAFYVAIEVHDDDHCPKTGDAWNEGDSATLYFDHAHGLRGSGVAGFAAAGRGRHIVGKSGAFDPAVATADWSNVDVAMSRKGQITTYEYRASLPDGFGPGSVLGVDIGVTDRDEDDELGDTSTSYWGPYFSKTSQSGRSADVVLVDPQLQLGTVRGQTVWSDDLKAFEPGGAPIARLISLDTPNRWVQVLGNDSHMFEADLPPGKYEAVFPYPITGSLLGPHDRVADSSRIVFEITSGSVIDAPPLVLKRAETPALYNDQGVLFDFTNEQAPELDAFVKAWMDYFYVPGLSLVLVKDGEIAYHQVYGYENAYTQDPVDQATLFEAASITKIVFAFAVMRLAERGVIDLDRPLHEYLAFDELEHDERYKLMTARHVLSHRTGLPNWRPDSGVSLAFTPGTDHQYSGEGIEYLKRVVVEITGKPIEQILMEDVQKPMGFPFNTHFADNEALRDVVAHGHNIWRPSSALIPKRAGMAHSMHTEARALGQFMLSLLERKGLRPESYDEMLTLTSASQPEPSEHDVPWSAGFGLGFGLFQTPYGQAFWHGGNNGDFHARFEAYPDHHIGFIVMGNNERAWAMGEVLRRYLIAGGNTPSSLQVHQASSVSSE